MPKQYRVCTYDLYDKKLRLFPVKDPNALVWGIPAIFTEDQIDNLNVSATTKKRIRGLKEGTILQLGMASNTSRQAIIVETKYDQEKISALEAELKQLNKEIRDLVGNKMKRVDEIRKELKELR